MADVTQSMFQNIPHVSPLVVLTNDAAPEFAFNTTTMELAHANIMTINKKTGRVHLVIEADTAYSDPIVGATFDIYVYYSNHDTVAFYQNMVINADMRMAIWLEEFMGVPYVYIRQTAGTVLKAQLVFE
jgi:hypothetical protein